MSHYVYILYIITFVYNFSTCLLSGIHTLVGLREEDTIHLKNAAKKTQLKYHNRRKKVREERD